MGRGSRLSYVMKPIVDVFKAEIDQSDVDQLLAARRTAIPALTKLVPGLLRADLVQLDDGSWLDILVWRDEASAAAAMACSADIPTLHEMHDIIGAPERHERGRVEHSL